MGITLCISVSHVGTREEQMTKILKTLRQCNKLHSSCFSISSDRFFYKRSSQSQQRAVSKYYHPPVGAVDRGRRGCVRVCVSLWKERTRKTTDDPVR